jgi:hypothetical protein
MATEDQNIQDWEDIKNEVTVDANTATRVGGAGEDTAQNLKDKTADSLKTAENDTALRLAPDGAGGVTWGAGGGGTVSTDATITGDGSGGSPLGVANEFTAADESKLDGIEALAEVNNISDVNATDLTDGGETTLHTHPAVASIYGSERQQDEDFAETSTSNQFGSSPVTKVSVTTGNLPAGTYKAVVSFMWGCTKDDKFEAAIYDGSSYVTQMMDYKSDENDNRLFSTISSGDLALSGVHTFSLHYGAGGMTTTVQISSAVIEFIRVA